MKRGTRRFGDCAVIVEVSELADAHRLALAIGRRLREERNRPDKDGRALNWAGVEDVVVGMCNVTVIVDPSVVELSALEGALESLLRDGEGPGPPTVLSGVFGESGNALESGHTSHAHEVPVRFDGPDLKGVATALGFSPGEVVQMIEAAELQVAFIGFSPGFAYLTGLPEVLVAVPRRATPRPSVRGGSFALGGGFAGIYPRDGPGGWNILGSTDLVLFDIDAKQRTLFAPGDRVRIHSTGVGTGADEGRDDRRQQARPQEGQRHIETSVARITRSALRPSEATPGGRMVVEQPGLWSSVQDRGRVGWASIGVPRGGPADPDRHRIANALVGNAEWEPAIEVTARGPTLFFEDDAHAAVVGDVGIFVAGREVVSGTVLPLAAGQRLEVGLLRSGLRATIAVAGGVVVDKVLGSSSSDSLCHLGPGPLKRGDVLGIGEPGRPRGLLLGDVTANEDPTKLRVIPGPDGEWDEAADALSSQAWKVARESDRVGLRLESTGGGSNYRGLDPIASRALVTGAVQVPPDGCPIVALCDHPTVGGYRVVATVIRADLGRLGRCVEGGGVEFILVGSEQAHLALAAHRRILSNSLSGWYPDRTD